MKKYTLYRLYAAAFMGMCLVPSVLMPFMKEDSSKEKRVLAEAPSLRTEEGGLNTEFFSQFDSWFSEHFAFRQQLVTADGRLRTALAGTSPNTDVIAGTDGWLYYGETADDYLNLNTLSQREINNIVHNLELMDRYCTERGADFLFTAAPNKNTVYPEHMPFNYVPADASDNYELLAQALEGSGYFLDMKETLLAAQSSIPLYHKTDTHWNNMGAYVGHVGLMGALGHEAVSAGGWTVRNDRLGDLAAMIYPSESPKDTQVYTDYPFTYSYQGHFRALDDITINTISQGGTGRLLMYRDSYGEAILPFMAEVYDFAEFSRTVPYRMDGIGGEGFDTVILEIVERNLGNLQKYAPLMEAPEAEPITAELYSVEVTAAAESSGQYTHLYGELPEELFTGDSHRIFVTAGGRTFEAFNAFEDKLLGREGEHSGTGFSLYIPADCPLTALTVTVLSGSEGRAAEIPDGNIQQKG